MMDATAQLNDLRRRVLAGEEVTREEYKEVVQALRSSRRAGELNAASKKKTPVAIDTSGFFDQTV